MGPKYIPSHLHTYKPESFNRIRYQPGLMRLTKVSLSLVSSFLVFGTEVHLDKQTASLDSADRVTRKEDGPLRSATWIWDGAAVSDAGPEYAAPVPPDRSDYRETVRRCPGWMRLPFRSFQVRNWDTETPKR